MMDNKEYVDSVVWCRSYLGYVSDLNMNSKPHNDITF